MAYRIGSGQGFYGDDVTRALPMITGGHVDIVCFEALSELTLAILQKNKLADPKRGYTFDVKIIAEKILPEAFKRKIPLITNGGGLNPLSAAEMVRKTAASIGLTGLKIATITGDNVLTRLDALQAAGESLMNMETGEKLADTENQNFITANVYLGAQPLVEALKSGADMVITGRVADPCLYLAAMVAHYGWAWDDWNRLASGIVAGHLLECTGQVVGGNSLALIHDTDASALPYLGYPIAEVEADGSFVLTKIPNSAGCVSIETVKEQLLYEIHDPANYITPDVVANLTTLHLEDVGRDRVRVTNVTGKPRTSTYKLNLGRLEGYSRELIFNIGWPEAWLKVNQLKAALDEIFRRNEAIERWEYSYLGANSLYGSLAKLPPDPMEVIVRVIFTAQDTDKLKQVVRQINAMGLSGPAGMSVSGASVGGNPHVILGLWPTLVRRDKIKAVIGYEEC
ncbi:MAG: acyclic terpene utilization AtuA family protein [Anaerolineaceae bacterium]|nr:acyclic terpene utilization AtuA family protein [Anaerolineaceae bacterium]